MGPLVQGTSPPSLAPSEASCGRCVRPRRALLRWDIAAIIRVYVCVSWRAPADLAAAALTLSRINEIIKNVLREVYKQSLTRVLLSPHHAGNQFTLQISGYREYLNGNYPLLCYNRVRTSLRGFKYLDVKLTEVPKEQEYEQYFPPTVWRREEDIKKEVFWPIDWGLASRIPILLWNSPVPLPKFDPAQSPAQRVYDLEQPRDEQVTEKMVDLPSIIQNFSEMKYQGERKDVLRSGECDFTFRVNVCGISNLMKVLLQDTRQLGKKRATYNGQIQPQYITKYNQKSLEQSRQGSNLNNTLYSQLKMSEDSKRNPTQRLGCTLDLAEIYNSKEKCSINEEPSNNLSVNVKKNDLQQIAQQYDLNFTPYLVSVQVMLCYGNRIIDSQETKKILFTFAPKWNEQLWFKNIMYSNLPLETRACFNVIVHGESENLSQVIASTSISLYKENGVF